MTTEASIIAALPSYLSFAADGTRVLNKEGLRTFVKAQMAAAMGRRSKGTPKTLTLKERIRRAKSLTVARKRRWL